jgi:hypothetical protein
MEKPIVIEVFNDNSSHSHWTLVDSETSEKLWSENPEECKAQGYPVETKNESEDVIKASELSKLIIDYWTNYPILGSSDELAELMLKQFLIKRK